jgi:hypothetical protein
LDAGENFIALPFPRFAENLQLVGDVNPVGPCFLEDELVMVGEGDDKPVGPCFL